MRDVAVVAFSQTDHAGARPDVNEVELMMPVVRAVKDATGLETHDIGFTCSGSSDYLAGQAFSFVITLDGIGPWPPIQESHVEMDGAWALYEAWIKLQLGEIDTALVYAYGKSSPGEVAKVLTLQLDPYVLAPAWPDAHSVAALQARALLDAGVCSERDLAEVVARNRRAGAANPHAHAGGDESVDDLLAAPYVADPLRAHDCPPSTDGAAAVILAAGDAARELSERPAWIRGIDHRIDPHSIGVRDLTRSPSAQEAARHAGVADGKVDVAELCGRWSHEEIVLARALGLDDGVDVNPSGGPLCAHPMIAAGLIRIGEAASRITAGTADRAVAHATSGPCLQQNLVCVLEGDG